MKKQKAYRHGEILLVKIKELPEGLMPSNTKTFMTGSHGNNHDIDKGTIYFKNEDNFVFGYLEARNTHLIHPEHKDKENCPIEDGYYKLIKQQEYTPEGLVPVID